MSLSNNTKKDFGTVKIWNNQGIDMTNNKIRNVATPNASTDAVNKSYVDAFRLIGDLKWSARNGDHSGWLVCDGRSVSRTAYAELFSVIGTSFGSSSGTTFNIPDCKGRVLGGIGNGSGLTNRSLGDSTGEETHTLTVSEIPSHNHTGTTTSNGSHTHTINDPGHTHTQTTINDDFNNMTGNPPGFTGDGSGSYTWSNINSSTTGITVNSAGNHTHTFTTGSTGSGTPFNVMQPTLFIGNVFVFCGILG